MGLLCRLYRRAAVGLAYTLLRHLPDPEKGAAMTEGPDNCAGCGHHRTMHRDDAGPCTIPACRCPNFTEENE